MFCSKFRRLRPSAAAILVAAMSIVYCRHTFAVPPSFAVIAAPDAEEKIVSREALSLIFQRKQLFWRNGKRMQPVNLPPANALRRAFSSCVLGRRPDEMEDYWREQYFHGVLPPRILASEEAILLFVDVTPGGIGYVSVCPSNMRANVLFTIGEPTNCPRRAATCL